MPEARRDGVLVRSLGDEIVAVDTAADRVHALSPSAAFVFKQCDGLTSLEDAQLRSGLSADDFRAALDELAAAGLVTQRGLDRRTLLKGAATVGAGAVALPTVWSIVAPTAAMAVSTGSGTQPPDFTLTGVMSNYLAAHTTAAGPFTFLAGPADAGQEWDGTLASRFNSYYADAETPGFATTSAGAAPIVNMNVSGSDVDVNTDAKQQAGWVAVNPSADASVIVQVALPTAPDYDVTVECFARHFDATAGDTDGVNFAVYRRLPGSALETVSSRNRLNGTSQTLHAFLNDQALGGSAYIAIDNGGVAGSDWTMVLMNVTFSKPTA
jgi:hypothetical protein